MRAAYIERLGGPEEIRVGSVNTPSVGPGDILVKVESVAANPVDTLVRSGSFPTCTPFPFVVGRDLVGEVVDRGGDVDGVEVGDVVWCNSLGHGGRQGSFGEYASVPSDRCYQVPPGVDHDEFVAVIHPAATAVLGLVQRARIEAGSRVFIGGGAGNVGSAALQLAVELGAEVVTSAHPRDHQRCALMGARMVVDYRNASLVAQLRDDVGEGFDVYWDTSGHSSIADALNLLAHHGHILITASGSSEVSVPVDGFYRNDTTISGFVMSLASCAALAAAAETINLLTARGRLHPNVVETANLEQTADVHARLERGSVRGRIVVRM